jgi:acyl-CoA synthetase (AMP-forming)/AMP-acid ligase II
MGRWTQQSGWDAMDAIGATTFAANPTLLWEVLVESRNRGRIPGCLRYGMSGGGPVPAALKKAWRDELHLPLVESYGQSELGGFVGLGYPDLEPDRRLGAVGPPLPDKEVRIFDVDDRELPIGQVGEICLRGGFMKGYWGRPEKTAETLRGGWLHTGDAGIIDQEGYVTMRGRFSELINVGNVTWFPRDVEDELCELVGVLQASVIGLPDEELGTRPIGCISIAPGTEIDEAAVRGSLQAKLSHYDLSPLTIKVVAEFPMTPTGKISKAQLAEQVSAARA